MIVVIIFAICVCLSPMTVLRGDESVSVIDIGLVASAILSVFYLHAQTLIIARDGLRGQGFGTAAPVEGTLANPIVRFCIIASFVLIVSALLNLQHRTVSDGNLLTVLSPYIATFIVVIVICMTLQSRASIVFVFSLLSTSIVLSLIYGAAIIAGFSSFYYESRFSGLSINPNQTAMHALSIIITGLSVLFKFDKNHFVLRYMAIISIIGAFFFGIYTDSDAFIISIFVVFVSIAIAISKKLFPNLKIAIAIGVFITAFGGVILALMFPDQVSSALDTFLGTLQTGNQDSDREILWRHGIQAWEANPIFGNGPGAWSGISMPFQGTESHNSYIDWLTIVGLAGFVPFVLSIGSVFRLNVGQHLASYFALFAILIFASFHFMFRLPIFWLPIILLQAESISASGMSLPKRRRQARGMAHEKRVATKSA